MAHAHDQTLDDQCPRHFHLHLCPGPSTPLAKNLQVCDFFKSGTVFYSKPAMLSEKADKFVEKENQLHG